MNVTRLTVLVENTAGRQGLLAEHGLAFWIEVNSRRILFDTGQGSVLLHNTDRLGIDLGTADAIVVSHGHYDHTGGLGAALDATNDRSCPVFLHDDALVAKYARNSDGTSRSIGMPEGPRSALLHSSRVRITKSPTEVCEGLWVTGPIPRRTDFEDTGGPFFRDERCLVPDDLHDDQAAFLETPGGVVVILGCAHAGIVNTLHHIRELLSGRRIHTVIGGAHLVSANVARMERTIEALRELSIERLCPLHCTGFAAAARLFQEFPGRVSTCPPYSLPYSLPGGVKSSMKRMKTGRGGR